MPQTPLFTDIERYHKVLVDFAYFTEVGDELCNSHSENLEEIFDTVFNKNYATMAIDVLSKLRKFAEEASDILQQDAINHLKNHNKQLLKRKSA